MKWIKSYTKFKERINEKVIYNNNSIKFMTETQVNKALKSLDVESKPQDVINWVKTTLLNPKSDSFLLRLPVEEMKTSGGVGGTFLPKGYHGISTPLDATHNADSGDLSYYQFMDAVFNSQFGLLSDPDDIKNKEANISGQVNNPQACGLFWIKGLFDKKFPSNKVPYLIVKYMVETIRTRVGKKIKFSAVVEDEFLAEFQPRIGGEKDIKVDDEKIPPGFFKEEGVNTNVPELKQILVKCGGRDLYKKGMLPADEEKLLLPIAQKKRLSFYNWFIATVYPSFTQITNDLDESSVTEFLKIQGVDTESGKVVYKVGDEVIYLRKDKNIEEWNKLSDNDKENLDKNPASDIVNRGKVTEVDGENIKIEYKPGEFVTKTDDQVVKKIEVTKKEKTETEEKEEN